MKGAHTFETQGAIIIAMTVLGAVVLLAVKVYRWLKKKRDPDPMPHAYYFALGDPMWGGRGGPRVRNPDFDAWCKRNPHRLPRASAADLKRARTGNRGVR